MRQITFQNFVWLDINPDQEEDMDKVREIVPLRDSTEEILESPFHLQRIEEFQNYLSVVLHYPLHDKIARKNIAIEIDIILTQGYLITAHRDDIHFLRDLFSSSESHPSAFEHPIELYLHLIETMLKACIVPLDRVASRIEEIEDQVFKGREFEMTKEISIVKRDVLDFRKIIRLHKPTITSSFQNLDYYFPEYTINKRQMNRILSTNVYIWEVLKNLKEAIEAFGESANAAVNRKLNENIHMLTLLSVSFAPPALIIALMGSRLPLGFIIESSYSPLYIFFIIVFIWVGLYVFFKKNDFI
ncbi:MAG: hypothetical protein BRC23_01025 [Parcubacteria group bacterium SW_4_49_11]|jgi:magnesium transporter|nr:MAG: hypothetical protein BRC23_01025 [Parcubacteria group bacterium SW_4_49_11]